MSNVENKGHQDYSRFDKLSTEILEDFLKADSDAPDAEQVDIEAIMYICALLKLKYMPGKGGILYWFIRFMYNRSKIFFRSMICYEKIFFEFGFSFCSQNCFINFACGHADGYNAGCYGGANSRFSF